MSERTLDAIQAAAIGVIFFVVGLILGEGTDAVSAGVIAAASYYSGTRNGRAEQRKMHGKRVFDLGVAIVVILAGWLLYWGNIDEQRETDERETEQSETREA